MGEDLCRRGCLPWRELDPEMTAHDRPHIFVDYHMAFDGSTVMIELASPGAVEQLHAIVQGLADGSAAVDLAGQPRTKFRSGLSMTLQVGVSEKHFRDIGPGPRFEWTCTPDEWRRMAMLLEPFLEGRHGHQYLADEASDDAIVEVSYGEDLRPWGQRDQAERELYPRPPDPS